MAVYLLRNYQGFTASATVPVVFQDDVETALIAQGLATAAQGTVMSDLPMGTPQNVTMGGNIASPPQGEQGLSTPAFMQGPRILPNIPIGNIVLTGYETNGTATAVAGTMYYSEIFVPYWNTWKGAGVLNGTTVGTDTALVALYGSNGLLLANSAVAGAVTANASVFQNRDFVSPILIPPGRYFIGYQSNGTTDTIRHFITTFGVNVTTGSFTGAFGTVLGQIVTVSTSFTTAQGPIAQLYT